MERIEGREGRREVGERMGPKGRGEGKQEVDGNEGVFWRAARSHFGSQMSVHLMLAYIKRAVE